MRDVLKISKFAPSSTLYKKVCTKLAKTDPCFVTLRLMFVR